MLLKIIFEQTIHRALPDVSDPLRCVNEYVLESVSNSGFQCFVNKEQLGPA